MSAHKSDNRPHVNTNCKEFSCMFVHLFEHDMFTTDRVKFGRKKEKKKDVHNLWYSVYMSM